MNLFDAAEAQRRKDAGMTKAADARHQLLTHAQAIARRISLDFGNVTSDDVASVMELCNLRYEDLGNAAGSVFRTDFEWTGKVVASLRVSTHGRMIKVWRLK